MMEERFEELINLYLDNEIGRHELGELKHAMKDNVLRRRKFERACQLHQAARKALTDRVEPAPHGAPAATPIPPSGNRSRGDRQPKVAKGSSSWVKSKQSQARRNASVPTLAERQSSKGAAGELDLRRVSLESSRQTVGTSSRQGAFSFFESPVGMLTGVLLTAVGGLGLFYVLQATSSGDEDNGKFGEVSVLRAVDGGYDPKAAAQLALAAKNHKAGGANGEDAVHSRIYQSALTGQEEAGAMQVNFYSSQTQPATPQVAVGSPGSGLPAPVTQNSVVDPANLTVSPANITQVQVTLPPTTGGTPDAVKVAPVAPENNPSDTDATSPMPALP